MEQQALHEFTGLTSTLGIPKKLCTKRCKNGDYSTDPKEADGSRGAPDLEIDTAVLENCRLTKLESSAQKNELSLGRLGSFFLLVRSPRLPTTTTLQEGTAHTFRRHPIRRRRPPPLNFEENRPKTSASSRCSPSIRRPLQLGHPLRSFVERRSGRRDALVLKWRFQSGYQVGRSLSTLQPLCLINRSRALQEDFNRLATQVKGPRKFFDRRPNLLCIVPYLSLLKLYQNHNALSTVM